MKPVREWERRIWQIALAVYLQSVAPSFLGAVLFREDNVTSPE